MDALKQNILVKRHNNMGAPLKAHTYMKRFVGLAFMVGVVSDLILRAMDRPRFRPYFESRGVVEAALIAGLIVVFGVLMAAVVVHPRERKKYLVAITIAAFITSWLHDSIEPLGPEIREHSNRADSRLLDTLVGPFVALVVYGIEDVIGSKHRPRKCSY